MTIEDEIATMESRLAELRALQAVKMAENKGNVIHQLCEFREQLDKIAGKAIKLARENDLVFWYSDGYDCWNIEDKEHWHGSNCHGSY